MKDSSEHGLLVGSSLGEVVLPLKQVPSKACPAGSRRFLPTTGGICASLGAQDFHVSVLVAFDKSEIPDKQHPPPQHPLPQSRGILKAYLHSFAWTRGAKHVSNHHVDIAHRLPL